MPRTLLWHGQSLTALVVGLTHHAGAVDQHGWVQLHAGLHTSDYHMHRLHVWVPCMLTGYPGCRMTCCMNP